MFSLLTYYQTKVYAITTHQGQKLKHICPTHHGRFCCKIDDQIKCRLLITLNNLMDMDSYSQQFVFFATFEWPNNLECLSLKAQE
jgi:hypothetical protein